MAAQLATAATMAATLNNARAARQVEQMIQKFVDATLGHVERLEAENRELRARLEASEQPAVPMV